jgi:hypothetical protein
LLTSDPLETSPVIVNTIEDKSVSVSIYVGVKVELAPSLIVNAVPADVGESFTFV